MNSGWALRLHPHRFLPVACKPELRDKGIGVLITIKYRNGAKLNTAMPPGERMEFSRRSICAAMAVALAPSVAQARRGGRGSRGPGLASGARPSGPVLSEAELEWCVRSERTIDSRAATIDTAEADLRAQEKQIERLDNDISAHAARLNRNSQRDVNDYNSKVQQHRSLVANFNNRVQIFNGEADRFNSDINAYNQTCANKSYFQNDYNRVIERLRGPDSQVPDTSQMAV